MRYTLTRDGTVIATAATMQQAADSAEPGDTLEDTLNGVRYDVMALGYLPGIELQPKG